MAWTYADWVTITDPAASLARLNLHIQEVSEQIGKERGSDGFNEGSFATRLYYDNLMEERAKLISVPGVGPGSNGGLSRGRMVRMRDVR